MTKDRPGDEIERAARILLSGGIIGLPTETVYGLAAVATDESAVSRVFEVKGRPRSHPLIMHLASTDDLEKWGVLDDNARLLAGRFMPGPLTLLVPRTNAVPDWVTGGRDTVALRVPSHRVAHELLEAVATALVAPSANRFGRVSPTTAEHVAVDLGDDVDLVLDGGPCEVGVESTIVECVDNVVRILRHGAVTESDLLDALPVEFDSDTGDSRAPGMLKSHYAPRARVVLTGNLTEALAEVSRLEAKGEAAAIVHHPDAREYAEHLYSDLRSADSRGADTIVAVLPDDQGIGQAVRDRLYKAAADQTGD